MGNGIRTRKIEKGKWQKKLKLELLGTDYKTAINVKLIKMKLENICREL